MKFRYLTVALSAVMGVVGATGCTGEVAGSAPDTNGNEAAPVAADKSAHAPEALTSEPGRDVSAEQIGGPGSLPPLNWVGDQNRGGDRGYVGGGLIYGMRVWSGDFVDQISLAYYIPSGRDNKYRAGDYWNETAPVGHNGGGDRGMYYCPAGSVAVGIQGSEGQAVDAVGLICGEIANPSRQTFLPMFGLGRGRGFSYNCGKDVRTGLPGFLTSMRIRSGNWMDALQGQCTAQN